MFTGSKSPVYEFSIKRSPSVTIEIDFNDSLIVTYPNNDDVIINWNISNPNILSISSSASNGIELLPLSTGQVILTLSITYENETITKDYYINICYVYYSIWRSSVI